MLFSWLLDSAVPNDTGPIYQETLMGRLPVEPFNTASNLIFLCIIIYFGIRVYSSARQHLFLAISLPVLAIGFIGGTVFHATRSHEIWLLMDWVPIMILCMGAVVYFVFKVYDRWLPRFLMLVGSIGVSFAVRLLPFPAAVSISLGYVVTAVTVLLPIFVYLIKTKGKGKELIFAAILSFAVAIGFRSADRFLSLNFLQMGTHWLWHLFGGVSVFFLMQYVYKDAITSQIPIRKP